MPFDLQLAINVIYPAANSAYQIMNVPAPALPAGYALVGTIKADPQAALAAMLASDPLQHRIVNGMLLESNIFGLVAWNQATSTALVSFRGTQTIMDWIDDVDTVTVPYISVPGAGFVHMGFQLVYEHIRRNVAQIVTNNCKGLTRLLVTGHSLGGAVAVLGGYDIAKNVTPGVVPELYTLAGPLAGAPDFAANFNKLIPVCHRIVNFMDVVPQVPLPPLYEHVGQEILVQGGFRPLDVAYAHLLSTYLAGLQKL
ncbi:MAG TPA: lipase family protein [Bryobacteraceae bacterium]|nr:lipase family protein [Bryobacteraceae bacterium]